MTRLVLDEDGVARLLARLSAGPGTELLPVVDADDLHEVDLDAELWHRTPDAPDHR